MHASTRAFIKRGGSAAAAAAVLLGGTFGAGAAMAAPASDAVPAASATVEAANVDTLLADYSAEFGLGQLQSIMVNDKGEFVIRTGVPAAGGPSATAPSFGAAATPGVDEFASRYGNVVIEAADGPAEPFAADITNGQGFLALSANRAQGGLCSLGWNGFNKEGAPAVISAGHCTMDGALVDTILTNPLVDPAITNDPNSGALLEPLGTFGASQFGGPGNTPATVPPGWDGDYNKLNNIGTDVSVIDVNGPNAPGLTQLPFVTDWTTPASPKDSGALVKGVSKAIVGTDICKSGRTTGWDCGTVSEVGVFLVQGISYPKDPVDPDAPKPCVPVATVPQCNDIRAVRGFGSTDLVTRQGDSGGAIIAGNQAVGMVSAGTSTITYGVDLQDALAHTDGYTVKIFLEAPKVTNAAPLFRGGTITGTLALAPDAPAGTKVDVTIGTDTQEVTVGADGTWTAKAPNTFGTFPVTAQAKNGYSTSATTTASIEVIKDTLPAPAITSPADGSSVAAPVTTIAGTGKPGATVKLTGDVSGTAVVAKDGKWSVTLPSSLVEPNWYDVTAMQTLTDWLDSPETTSGFTIAPNGPAIMSPANGTKFIFNKGPSVISGTNVAQATVHVTVNGKGYDALVDGTAWSVTLDAPLGSGSYAITATQQWGDFASLTSTSAFVVQAEPKPEPTTAPTTQQPTPTTPAPTAAPTTPAPGGGNLANTGASGTTILLGAAGGLLLLGGVAFLLIRRRSSH
ncbi:LPXTG cell wall anchor domain-containing protein [Arthrobacter sp. HY1533]|uniref:LPXTG cell wall anchor domain-containing protein n=1 Tax=Arthrobacter sp. HY1533 TaxID=2970919 RepID=UPI0022B9FC9F|nr:LPXTG cell wall anchor domain-containing protein [Arthrobacter sp. HY1533]